MTQDAPKKTTPADGRMRLAELLGAFSHALDVTEGQPVGHCVRCCWIGIHLGRELGLSPAELSDLYYALLLKDLGCSSNAARICNLYLVDDLAFKRDFKQVDGSLSAALRFVFSHTGLEADLAARFRAIIHILQNGGQIARELIETRCRRGGAIARQMRFSDDVATAIEQLDEHWDGGGKPDGVAGADIHLFARIALMAQVVDVFLTSAGKDAAMREIELRSGTWFDPRLVETMDRLAQHEGFWERLAADDLDEAVFSLEPALCVRHADAEYLDEIAEAFADVIDSKSPFTSGHSKRVAVFTDLVAEELGLDRDHRRWLKRAALLHDIGKLGVSNSILDKPGKPTEAEWQAIRHHAVLTERILSRMSCFRDMAAIAAAHHERLDGRGYPKGLKGEEIAFESRILMVADVFDALTAERPYRDAMPVSKALSIMRGDVGAAIDPRCFAALESVVAKLDIGKAA